MSDRQPAATAVRIADAESRQQPALLSVGDFRVRPHNCFACGELNEAGLHLTLHLEPGRCWTELTIPNRFEGWEGVIHGGIQCTILDEMMGWALLDRDFWGVTARLNVDFRRPVVVGQAIRAEGWIIESRRRIQRTAGRIVDVATGQELATAEATYVAAPDARKAELKNRYGALKPTTGPGTTADTDPGTTADTATRGDR